MSGYVVIGHMSSYVCNIHAYKPVICTHRESESGVCVSSTLKILVCSVEYKNPANNTIQIHQHDI